MTPARRRIELLKLHTAKLLHARLLGVTIPPELRQPTRQSVHRLQIIINTWTKK